MYTPAHVVTCYTPPHTAHTGTHTCTYHHNTTLNTLVRWLYSVLLTLSMLNAVNCSSSRYIRISCRLAVSAERSVRVPAVCGRMSRESVAGLAGAGPGSALGPRCEEHPLHCQAARTRPQPRARPPPRRRHGPPRMRSGRHAAGVDTGTAWARALGQVLSDMRNFL